MPENADQNNSEYGQFSRSENLYKVSGQCNFNVVIESNMNRRIRSFHAWLTMKSTNSVFAFQSSLTFHVTNKAFFEES